MSNKRIPSSLLSPQARGGNIAEEGFQYQFNSTIIQIPKWLAQDGFTEMIREALGDVEAKFFVPESGIRHEFVEFKNTRLKRKDFWKEINHFREIEQQAPNSHQQFVLTCSSFTDELLPITNSLKRVRNPYSFYDSVQQINEISYADFVAVVKSKGESEETAEFLFLKVRFNLLAIEGETHARGIFIEEMKRYFPEFRTLSGESTNTAYSKLTELVKSRTNQPIYRHELENAIWHGIIEKDRPKLSIRLYTSHEENVYKGPDDCLQFNWESVFGGTNRNYPSIEVWNQKVTDELCSTKKWIIASNRTRHIHLSGHRRLSASVAIGATFSAVSGFTIEMETKDGLWFTNNHATNDTPDYKWIKKSIIGKLCGEIAVGISILKDTVNEDVDKYLDTIHFKGNRLYLYGNAALQSDHQTNCAVHKAKSMIQGLINRTQAEKIHLFFAGPAQFALFLGHRLNSLGKIQNYEWVPPNLYKPTVLITT